MSTSAADRIANAFAILNVFMPGETIPTSDSTFALGRLNGLMTSLKLDALIAPVSGREVFPIVVGKGSPSNPYTIGPGGDFNTTRPATAASLTSAAILLGTTGVEIPRALLTDAQFNDIRIKGLPSGLATWAHYDGTYASGLGTITLYPVPNVLGDAFVLYREMPLAVFTSLASGYDLPEGYEEMIDYNLAKRLAGPYGRAMAPSDLQIAADSLALVKRSNVQLDDLAGDPMFMGSNPRAGYDIQTGE